MAKGKHVAFREVRRGRTLMVLTVLAMLAGLLVLPGAATASPSSVAIAGSLQDELGCPGDWQPECAATELTYDAEGDVWQATFNLPAGSWEYKAALDDSFDENYGAGGVANGANIQLSLAAPTDVKFYYDDRTHWVTDNVNSVVATAVGDFQSELGCSSDWQPDCLRTWLQDPDGDGVYSFSTAGIPAGSHEAKVTLNEAWDVSFPASNEPFSVPGGCTVVTFTYDSADNSVNITDSGCDTPHVVTVNCGADPLDVAIIHYNRPADDYGIPSPDFNTFWGLHLWGDAIDLSEATEWTSPKPFEGDDEFGRFAWIERGGTGSEVNFIIHQGDTKDTDPDRSFNADVNPEVWINQGDETVYISQADAQGYATIHYHRDDGAYGDPTSPDFNDFWGLHLWGDAVIPSEATDWTDPKTPTGIDSYGPFWDVLIDDSSEPVNFIIHRGDTKDPGPDQSMVPFDDASVWVMSGDATIYGERGEAQDFATIHYHRDDGDYGDPTSTDFNDFWGLHVWDGALVFSDWTDPVRPVRFDVFGAVFEVNLGATATQLGYILHRGDEKDPGPDQFMVFADVGYELWQQSGDDGRCVNSPPVADANGPYTVDEGSPFTLDGSGSWDAEDDPAAGDITTYEWDLDNDGEYDDATGEFVTWTYPDGPSQRTVGLRVTDSFGATDTTTAIVQVLNVAPTLSPISGPAGPIALGTDVTVTASYTDPGVLDTHTAVCDWGDGGLYPVGTATAGSAFCTYQYAMPGIYTMQMTVTDNDGGSDTETLGLQIVVYDPSAGFVTGGGWFYSEAGAYADDLLAEGKASFGFVAKYKKGANVPDGNTQFQFKAGNLNFHSTSYEWLVVSGSDKAKFKGVGTINGSGEYKFMISAGDNDPDTFRIKIWTEETPGVEIVVYDNGPDQAIDGGNIVIHTKK